MGGGPPRSPSAMVAPAVTACRASGYPTPSVVTGPVVVLPRTVRVALGRRRTGGHGLSSVGALTPRHRLGVRRRRRTDGQGGGYHGGAQSAVAVQIAPCCQVACEWRMGTAVPVRAAAPRPWLGRGGPAWPIRPGHPRGDAPDGAATVPYTRIEVRRPARGGYPATRTGRNFARLPRSSCVPAAVRLIRSPPGDRGWAPVAGSFQYQPRDRKCAHAPQGVSYRCAMYFRPHLIWVRGLVRQSLPAPDILRPGMAWGIP